MNNNVDNSDIVRMSSAAAQARAMTQGDLDWKALATLEEAAIDKWNPKLNAFIQRAHPSIRTAGMVNSPLSGTSFAVKDNIAVKGLPTHAGLRALAAAPASKDATVVKRLKQAGLAFTGKLNMSPMALGASTHNTDYGDCFNPYRTGLSAGGSSGGSASAVAAGLVGIALGTDTMGSVRLPAALCGVVGFKPSWGRVPVDGLVPLCAMLDHIGVLSRSVEDAAFAYSIISADPPLACQENTKLDNCSGPAQKNNGSNIMRLGVPQNCAALQLQPDVAAGFESACERLTAHGYLLEPVDMSNVNLSAVRRAGLMLCEAELLTTLESVYPDRRRQLPQDLVRLLDFIQEQTTKKLGRAVAKLAESRCSFETWMSGLDAFVLPTSTHTAFPMSGSAPTSVADLTVIANITGAPAISLPLPVPIGELPIGLQLVGCYGQDQVLLELSSKVESLLVSPV